MGADRAQGGARHDPGADDEPAVVVDAGEELRLGPVLAEHPADDVHLPELHGPAPLPALVGREGPLLARDGEPAARQHAMDGREARGRLAAPGQGEGDAPGAPVGVGESQLDDRRGALPVELAGHRVGTVAVVAQPDHPLGLVARHPGVDRLAADADLARHLGDGEAVPDDHLHRLVALLHLADLLEHEPPPRREVETSGGRVSRIS